MSPVRVALAYGAVKARFRYGSDVVTPSGISVDHVDRITIITLDDEKVNVLTEGRFLALQDAFDEARSSASAVVIAGRPGCFSAGLDLGVVRGADSAALERLRATGTVLWRAITDMPIPVVAACTGHAIAGGAMLLLTCDWRIGLRGDFRIGLTEVAVGVEVPQVVFGLAERRLARNHLLQATVLAKTSSPDVAQQIGFLDEVVDSDVMAASVAAARTLAELPQGPFQASKERYFRSMTGAEVV